MCQRRDSLAGKHDKRTLRWVTFFYHLCGELAKEMGLAVNRKGASQWPNLSALTGGTCRQHLQDTFFIDAAN